MTTKSKVYVIDPDDTAESGTQKGRVGKRGIERTDYSPDSEGPQGARAQGSRARGRRMKGPVEEQGSPLLAFLSYLAGPYAILATRRGRESKFWVVLAILTVTGAAILFARANKIFAAPHGAGIGFIFWLSVACIAAILGFATWARGVFLLGRHKGRLLKRLPAWVRHPGTAGALGILIPGFGLFVAQHPRRAACALLAACATVIAALVLWQAPALWRLSQAGILVEHGEMLERIFLVMGAVGAIGALARIAQALDGARLAGAGAEGPESRHGDWATVALVLAIAALLVTFKPAHVAETLDRFAISLREDGLRVIPLAATQAAMRLDPSRPEYAVQAIELNEALGHPSRALAIRRDLAERWKPYERMLQLEAAATELIEPAVFRPEEP
ncbi:MAG: hypothetical protein WC674_07540 [Candidatus Krumholzibacteriia bacterium]